LTTTKPQGVSNELRLTFQGAVAVQKYQVVLKTGTAPAPGTIWVQYSGYKDCMTKGGGFATGTVEITRADTRIAGSYQLSFASGFVREGGSYGAGDTKGDFDAGACNATGGIASICP